MLSAISYLLQLGLLSLRHFCEKRNHLTLSDKKGAAHQFLIIDAEPL